VQPGTIQLTALGDFDASPLTAELFDANSSARDLKFPLDTRAVSAELTAGTSLWFGVGERSGDDIDLPLWPQGDACTLYPVGTSASYPGAVGGEAIGWSPSQKILLIAGEASATSDSASAVVVNLKTGVAQAVPDGMSQSRAYATVTPFGKNLLVAGGVDALNSPGGVVTNATPLDNASVYDTSTGRFDPPPLRNLSHARAHQAAVVLDSGETLLIGGVDDQNQPLSSLEALSPSNPQPRLTGLAKLTDARIDPFAIRLTDGHILVAGGHDLDRAPIDLVEWLSADADQETMTAPVPPAPAPPRFGQAFVAMPGGAALAVFDGCENRTKKAGEDCDACPLGGCPSSTGFDVYWISPDGVPTHVQSIGTFDPTMPKPLLIPASNGAPWLDASGHWLRFDPWQAKFVVPPVSPSSAPSCKPAKWDVTGGCWPEPVALDSGLFVWLQDEKLLGFRSDTRDEYAFDVAPLLSTPAPQGAFPDSSLLHTAPDRPPLAPGTPSTFEAGGVPLEPGSALVVTDTTYIDLHLEISLDEGSMPPLLELGTTELGGAACPWSEPSQPAPKGGWTLTVDRSGSSVTLGQNNQTHNCSMPTGRVSVALKAGGGTASVQSLLVRRKAQAP
jgi:hypothetical protein